MIHQNQPSRLQYMNRIFAGLLSLIFVVALANAAAAADAANGQMLAKRWCAACHVVASDQQSANGQAAPFSVIGKTPDLDSGKLALFLLLPHPKMPDMNLSRSEAADIAAYIATQGK
jgi:mono/diheme cytochrome c family protein